MSKVRAEWSNGLQHELNYWQSIFDKSFAISRHVDIFHERLNGDYPLRSDLHRLVKHVTRDSLDILDVGAGPLSHVGTNFEKPINLVCIDPLAEHYISLYEKHNYRRPVDILPIDGEQIREHFASNSFDLVFSRNALDHSYDPIEIIANMVDVARPGCFVRIEGRINEAEGENYRGLHQWNFEPTESGDVRIWNATTEHSLSARLGPEHQLKIAREGERWLRIEIQKCPTMS